MAEETQSTATSETTANAQPATPAAQQGATSAEPTLTQSEVNRIVGERAKDAAKAATSKLLADLGFESVDDLKTLVVAAKKAKEAEMSELEKLAAELEKERKEKAEAKALVEQERQSRLIDRRNSAITSAAQSARAEAPGDVILWAESYHKDDIAKVLADDGSVNEKAVTALIDKCRAERKNWFAGGAPGSPSNREGRNPTPDLTKFEGVPKIRL